MRRFFPGATSFEDWASERREKTLSSLSTTSFHELIATLTDNWLDVIWYRTSSAATTRSQKHPKNWGVATDWSDFLLSEFPELLAHFRFGNSISFPGFARSAIGLPFPASPGELNSSTLAMRVSPYAVTFRTLSHLGAPCRWSLPLQSIDSAHR